LLIADYRAGLIAAGKRHKGRYPGPARDNAWEGTVHVRIAVARDGAVAVRVRSSSGYPILDREALEIVRKAVAHVRLPDGLRGKSFSVELPVVYNLTDQRSG
jgi:protein TonB